MATPLLILVMGVGSYLLARAIELRAAWGSIERVSLQVQPEVDEENGEAAASPSSSPPATGSSGSASPWRTDADNDHEPGSATASEPGPSETGSFSSPSSSFTTSTTTDASRTGGGGEGVLAGAEDPPASFLIVGTDARKGLEDLENFGDFAGERADVIVVAVRRGEKVSLLSVPRDLHVEDVCDGGRHRINAAYEPCNGLHPLANLTRQVQHVTGIDLDHAVAVDMAGFQAVVDRIGGYEICTDHPLRDVRSGLELGAGCTVADGETTLQWLRSRQTERRIDGSWEPVPHVSDLERNRRQRRFLVDLLGRVSERSGPGELLAMLRAAAPHLVIDDRLALSDLAAWAWRFREADVATVELPVEYRQTDGGDSVLVPTVDVESVLADVAS